MKVVLHLKVRESHVDLVSPWRLDGPHALAVVRVGLGEVRRGDHATGAADYVVANWRGKRTSFNAELLKMQ